MLLLNEIIRVKVTQQVKDPCRALLKGPVHFRCPDSVVFHQALCCSFSVIALYTMACCVQADKNMNSSSVVSNQQIVDLSPSRYTYVLKLDT